MHFLCKSSRVHSKAVDMYSRMKLITVVTRIRNQMESRIFGTSNLHRILLSEMFSSSKRKKWECSNQNYNRFGVNEMTGRVAREIRWCKSSNRNEMYTILAILTNQ